MAPTYLSPADATAAFNGGKVDAWVVWDRYCAIAQERYKARVIIPRKISVAAAVWHAPKP